jgi:hypothetical protein
MITVRRKNPGLKSSAPAHFLAGSTVLTKSGPARPGALDKPAQKNPTAKTEKV